MRAALCTRRPREHALRVADVCEIRSGLATRALRSGVTDDRWNMCLALVLPVAQARKRADRRRSLSIEAADADAYKKLAVGLKLLKAHALFGEPPPAVAVSGADAGAERRHGAGTARGGGAGNDRSSASGSDSDSDSDAGSSDS